MSQAVVSLLVSFLLAGLCFSVESAFQGGSQKASYVSNRNSDSTHNVAETMSRLASIGKQSVESYDRLHSAYPSADIEEEAFNLGDEETVVEESALEIRTPSPKAAVKLTAVAPLAMTAQIVNSSDIVECSNDSLKQDFGTACLKKSIQNQVSNTSTSRNRKPVAVPAASNIVTSGTSKSRYFSVKPMVSKKIVKLNINSGLNAFKSPGTQARQLYDSKGYDYALKGTKGIYPSSNNNRILTPSKFYSSKPTYGHQESVTNNGRVDRTKQVPQHQSPDEEEWNAFENAVPTFEEPAKPSSSSSLLGEGYQEELELLTSLKKSLGVLSAQATNLKQRAVILYQEARRRRLYFFDALLSRTYNYMNEKQDETRSAITDIENTVEQIQEHQQVNGLDSLRKLRYYLGDDAIQKRMKKQNLSTSLIDRKEIDRLIEDALKHAQRMMSIIKELNEALDEFEEQFNMPRYEPNNIELFTDSKEDF